MTAAATRPFWRRGPKGAPRSDGPRELVTPEGVDLRLQVGAYGERLTAMIIDMLILFGAMLVFGLVAALVFWATRASWLGQAVMIVSTLSWFLGRNFYFFWFEAQPRAATPGKRAMGLRVASADGGRLTADAVFARNAMREVEVFLPLTFFSMRGEGVDAALIGLGVIWALVLVLFPLFNRDRRRLGDLVAGTIVVKAPKRILQTDLADVDRRVASGLTFTPAQLEAYGIKELHVLEDVIRAGDRKAMKTVADRIRAKIAWDGPADVADVTFLNAYYAGLRGRLESRLLFGQRRRDKFDVS
ncbi:MAG: RDD family protein [Phenylobacterium sp.]|nr:RDD family protein [Phenylobacterium sp.]